MAALVLGISALCVPYVGIVTGIVAIVLGVLARKEIRANPGLKGDGMALTGLILGIVGMVLYVLVIVFAATVFTSIIHACNANPSNCTSSSAPQHAASPDAVPAWVAPNHHDGVARASAPGQAPVMEYALPVLRAASA